MIIVFKKNLYSLAAIKKGAEAFKNLADFQIKESPTSIETTINNIDKEFEDNFRDEFCNFVLAETKNDASFKQFGKAKQ
jgi:hypothetical protein